MIQDESPSYNVQLARYLTTQSIKLTIPHYQTINLESASQ